MVSLISRQVIEQFEELLGEAGLEPFQIDFTSFRLFELFAPKFVSEEDYVFISHVTGVLSVMLMHGGVLSFCRYKELGGRSFSANRIFREISSSLLVYNDKNQGIPLGKVYCYVDREHGEEFRSIAAEATNQEPVLLDISRVVASGPSSRLDADELFSMSAALGAAVRNL
jgi:type IV pilus assembly protein PilM